MLVSPLFLQFRRSKKNKVKKQDSHIDDEEEFSCQQTYHRTNFPNLRLGASDNVFASDGGVKVFDPTKAGEYL